MLEHHRTATLASAEDPRADDVVRLAYQSFGLSRELSRDWITSGGPQNWRVLIGDSGETAACALLVAMGQYLGGRSVQMTGVSGVAVGPEARGRGLGRELMRQLVRELHTARQPISVLYSALHPLYRGAGYEIAGVVCFARVPAAMFDSQDRGDGWRVFTPEDLPSVQACYAAHAATQHGFVDRGPYIWERVQRYIGEPTEGFVADDGSGGVEAYIFFRYGEPDPYQPGVGTQIGSPLLISDMAWSTPRGLSRLLAFLRGFSSIVGEVTCFPSPSSPLLMALPDRRFRLEIQDGFMLRVTHLEEAITQRGYPPGPAGTLHIELDDAALPEQAGRWVVTLDGRGGAACERGGEGRIRLNACALAPLYTGYGRASQLSAAGLIECTTREAELWDATFGASGLPAMVDRF